MYLEREKPSPIEILSGALASLSAAPLVYILVFLTLSAVHLESRLLMDLSLELVLCAAIALFFIPALAQGPRSSVHRLLIGCLLLLVSPLISSLVNGERCDVLQHPEFRSWAKILLVFPLLPWLCRSVKSKERLVDTVLASVALFTLIVLYRYYVLGEMRELDERPSLRIKNGDPNFICLIIAVALPFVFYRILEAFQQKRRLVLSLSLFCLALFVFGIALTESRMGIIAILTGILVLAYRFRAKRKTMKLAGAVLIVVLGTVLLGTSLQRFKTLDDDSNRARLRTLSTGLQMFFERPLLGAGWYTSPDFYFEYSGYGRLLSEGRRLTVHNTFLQLLSELGIMGFALYAFLFFFVGREILKSAREGQALGAFCLSAFIILILNLVTLPLLGKDFVLIYLAVLLCLTHAREEGSPA